MTSDTSTKKNRTASARDGFVASWMIGTVSTWIIGIILAFILTIGVFLLIAGQAFSQETGMSIILYVLILPAGFMMGITQKNALREHLGLNVRHWAWVTAIAWSAGLFLAVNFVDVLNVVYLNREARQLVTLVWVMMVVAVPSFAQAWLLRGHLEQTWVYALAGLVAGLICGTILRDENNIFWLLVPVISGGLSAMVLMWLTSPTTARMRLDEDKQK